jgi:hypothetical protein
LSKFGCIQSCDTFGGTEEVQKKVQIPLRQLQLDFPRDELQGAFLAEPGAEVQEPGTLRTFPSWTEVSFTVWKVKVHRKLPLWNITMTSCVRL